MGRRGLALQVRFSQVHCLRVHQSAEQYMILCEAEFFSTVVAVKSDGFVQFFLWIRSIFAFGPAAIGNMIGFSPQMQLCS
jgi:hypothetical protein